MKKIRVCIGSTDGKNISKTHMGDTESFHIYDLFEDAKYTFIEKRENFAIDEGHSTTGKMKKILGIVADSDVLVATKKSPNFVKIANKTKYQPVVVKTTDIADTFVELHKAFDTIYEYVTRRKAGEKFDIIPEL